MDASNLITKACRKPKDSVFTDGVLDLIKQKLIFNTRQDNALNAMVTPDVIVVIRVMSVRDMKNIICIGLIPAVSRTLNYTGLFVHGRNYY
jgi:hypothetical protein